MCSSTSSSRSHFRPLTGASSSGGLPGGGPSHSVVHLCLLCILVCVHHSHQVGRLHWTKKNVLLTLPFKQAENLALDVAKATGAASASSPGTHSHNYVPPLSSVTAAASRDRRQSPSSSSRREPKAVDHDDHDHDGHGDGHHHHHHHGVDHSHGGGARRSLSSVNCADGEEARVDVHGTAYCYAGMHHRIVSPGPVFGQIWRWHPKLHRARNPSKYGYKGRCLDSIYIVHSTGLYNTFFYGKKLSFPPQTRRK